MRIYALKRPVYLVGLTWRQVRDDPGRAPRLAVRLLARGLPGPLGGRRLARSRLAVPRPRGVRRESAELRALLAHTPPSRPARPVDRSGSGTTVLQFVTNALPRTNAGYTVRTHRIALAQREMGFDTHVATRLGYPLSQGIGDARARVDVDGVPYHRLLPWLPPAGPVRGVERGADLAGRLVGELRPDVLHAVSNHLNAAVALELGRRHGLPVVYEVRGFLEDSWLSRDPAHSESDEFYRLTRELETRRMAEADAVVTLGEAMRAEIAARGVPEEKIFIVPNGVDEAFLEPLPDASGLRAELGIAADATVVGLTSSFYGYEGIDTLIDAAALLRDRGAPVTLLLVGDGPERGALERRAAGHGVHAVFTGRVPMGSVRRYHALLDVFAVPRRADRVCQLVTPLKPLEAMAGGIPVIASDVRALREIVEPGVTGALTLPENAEAWANCLEDLAYSPESRQKTGQRAREWVRAERTWRAVAKGYRAAYGLR
ncbi:glycosyltransferase family 4 protein [Actinomadura opuntiae]|uniref:glycosyltransferase family 4 protein n=1 Tax=Actinomadura sp. OS1-43 TaxID=604315 RepID=UPI00255AF05F|nr:glycosyltransferase family 4 protein [Actinomadura sp. OS1-43]MDL4814693.1 glycosyltransferase family 4 protein [Actinomadura sp. OS1-43]